MSYIPCTIHIILIVSTVSELQTYYHHKPAIRHQGQTSSKIQGGSRGSMGMQRWDTDGDSLTEKNIASDFDEVSTGIVHSLSICSPQQRTDVKYPFVFNKIRDYG